MSQLVGEIGYFQLNNLIQNKVPFSLLLIDINSTEKIEGSIEVVLRLGVHLTAQNFLGHVEQLKVSLEHPFVLVCIDGTTSFSLASKMVEKGYKNVYCIKGGWKSLNSNQGVE